MHSNQLLERHSLRRKISFWRVFAILAAIAAIGIVFLQSEIGEFAGDKSNAHIARVTISGVITDQDELLTRLKKINENENVKAVIVRISSPGGTTYGGEMLFKAISKISANRPVVSEIRSLAASAGYMIATAGNHIVAGESSLVGSIGVIFQYAQVSDLLDKIGVSVHEIKSSPLKAEPSPFHKTSPEAQAMIANMIDDSYNWFVDLVVERRKMPLDKVKLLADGRVFTGRQALKENLIDELGSSEEVRAYLTSQNISKDYKIIDWEAKRENSGFLIESVLQNAFLRAIGLNNYVTDPSKKASSSTFFLDGLVSVWQFGSTQKSE